MCVCTDYLQLQVVSQACGTVHSEQRGLFLLAAETQRQAVSSRAGPLVRGPRIHHHAPVTAKDVRGTSCSHTHIYIHTVTHEKIKTQVYRIMCLKVRLKYDEVLFFSSVHCPLV